ncbi:UDP-3-O-acyl-N-acetylglucosamine deacetylase [Tistlia consotensis]|nr:UDP-3-O-acyl-N-acetylglucosamine deacetylase [Tistlia consotensis]
MADGSSFTAITGFDGDVHRAFAGTGGGPSVQTQRTLKNAIHCSGIGLHSGLHVAMTLKPAESDSGIVFRRVDLPGSPEIPALWTHAIETPLCTTIVTGDVKIATIEHLLSAFAGLEIDNCLIEIDGPEVPAMDGSSAPFVFLIECAGIVEQRAPRRGFRILEAVEESEPHRSCLVKPAETFEMRFEIEFDSRAIGRQVFDSEIDPAVYKRDVSRARTFGFLQEVEALRQHGLARGGSLENAVVIDGDQIMNEGGLRYTDEFVRHKALDCIGDLYLAGGPMIGRFEGIKAGHALTLRLLKSLFAREGAVVREPLLAPVAALQAESA